MKKKFGSLVIFLASLLWAADAPFRKPLLIAGLGTGFIAFLEHLLNSLAALPGLIKARADFKKLSLQKWLGLIYVGAFASALAAILFVKGATVMNYNFTVAALLQKFQPLFAIFLAAFFLKEKIYAKFWLLAIAALFGAYLVSFGITVPSALFASATNISLLGPLLAILAALLWAGGTVVGRALLSDLDFKFVTGMRFVFGLVFLFFYVLLYEKMQFFAMTPFYWQNTLIIALMTGFFALLIYYYGLRQTKASIATLMELGYPLALTLINWKFLGITLTAWQIFGALLLLASVTSLSVLSTRENKVNQEK